MLSLRWPLLEQYHIVGVVYIFSKIQQSNGINGSFGYDYLKWPILFEFNFEKCKVAFVSSARHNLLFCAAKKLPCTLHIILSHFRCSWLRLVLFNVTVFSLTSAFNYAFIEISLCGAYYYSCHRCYFLSVLLFSLLFSKCFDQPNFRFERENIESERYQDSHLECIFSVLQQFLYKFRGLNLIFHWKCVTKSQRRFWLELFRFKKLFRLKTWLAMMYDNKQDRDYGMWIQNSKKFMHDIEKKVLIEFTNGKSMSLEWVLNLRIFRNFRLPNAVNHIHKTTPIFAVEWFGFYLRFYTFWSTIWYAVYANEITENILVFVIISWINSVHSLNYRLAKMDFMENFRSCKCSFSIISVHICVFSILFDSTSQE